MATPSFGGTPLSVDFSGSDSSDPEDGTSLSYAWDFEDDGIIDSTEAEPTHVFSSDGDFTVRLTVTDSMDAEGNHSHLCW